MDNKFEQISLKKGFMKHNGGIMFKNISESEYKYKTIITENHLNVDEKASTSLEIDMGINRVPEDMVLIVYAHFTRQIKIDGDRKLTIIE